MGRASAKPINFLHAYTVGPLCHGHLHIVMAGLVPAIHDLSCGTKNVDAREKPGHDEWCGSNIFP